MFAGRVACCPLIGLVSHGEYGDGTDGRTTNRCITLLAVNATSAVMYAFPSHRKAPSTLATMSKQQETLSKQRFDFVDATFDFLPQTATMSNEISSFRQNRNKLNMFNLFRHCRKDEISFDIVADTGNIVAKNGNNVQCRSNIRHCRKSRSTCSVQQCCFDIVAGVDAA